MPLGLELCWLPDVTDWTARIKKLEAQDHVDWVDLVRLANARLDHLRTGRLDRLLGRHFQDAPPAELATRPVRLAMLSSSTQAHLHAGLRVAALRRGMWLTIYEGVYGQYLPELLAPSSGLRAFRPDAVLLALDAHHIGGRFSAAAQRDDAEAAFGQTLEGLRTCWRIAREDLGVPVIQQTILPVLPPLLGNNEQRLAGSPAGAVRRLNATLREIADGEGIHLLALDAYAAQGGVRAWHDPVMWHRAKQEVSPAAAPLYGELAARILTALQGRASKCLVLDLDNTLWGGVIGDDGLEGIALGQGSTLGEAFLSVQAYARALADRGVILAVCSKNDEANALVPFEKHPDMLLRREHIAAFFANWDDKATNIRRIARELNIGLDSLVFLDDNPFERNLVRENLPEVAVPEIPDDDPALVPQILADAGYFESIAVTADDRNRTAQYQANRARAALGAAVTDMPSYLRSLEMELVWSRFDQVGLPRVAQLINKSNQFNLRTRRYTEEDVAAVMQDPTAFGLQLRLLDRFGDNGIIAVVIGRMQEGSDCLIDTWLMSCRVLGRQVEEATLNLVVAQARALGARRLLGEYIPTAKNGMVAEHYRKLGFAEIKKRPDGGSLSSLDVAQYADHDTLMRIQEAG